VSRVRDHPLLQLPGKRGEGGQPRYRGQAASTLRWPASRSEQRPRTRAAACVGKPVLQLPDHLRKAWSHEQVLLVVRRVVWGLRHDLQIERQERCATAELTELAIGGQEPRAVRLDVAVFERDAKFERVPVEALDL